MKPATLNRIIETTLRAALGPAVLLAGCGTGLPADPSAYELAECANGIPSLAKVRPGTSVDFAELRQIFTPTGVGPGSPLSSFGTACATAMDAAACKAQLAALMSDAGFGKRCVDLCSAYYLATTKGDTVAAVTSDAGFRAFLGAIDVAAEAALVAVSQGYNVSCTEKTRGGVRAIPTGWEVIGTKGIACGPGTAPIGDRAPVTIGSAEEQAASVRLPTRAATTSPAERLRRRCPRRPAVCQRNPAPL